MYILHCLLFILKQMDQLWIHLRPYKINDYLRIIYRMPCPDCESLHVVVKAMTDQESHWYQEYLKLKEKGDEQLKKEYEEELSSLKKQLESMRNLVVSQAEELRQTKLSQKNHQGTLKILPKRDVNDYYGEYARPMQYIDPVNMKPLDKNSQFLLNYYKEREIAHEKGRKMMQDKNLNCRPSEDRKMMLSLEESD